MKLIELNKFFEMDTGAPSPQILSSEHELYITFFIDSNESDMSISIKFNSHIYYTHGVPSNETLQGHPYYKIGLRPYGFFELKESNLVSSLKEIGQIHPYYDPKEWEGYKHFILTFHDSMFECVAESFEIKRHANNMRNEINKLLKKKW